MKWSEWKNANAGPVARVEAVDLFRFFVLFFMIQGHLFRAYLLPGVPPGTMVQDPRSFPRLRRSGLPLRRRLRRLSLLPQQAPELYPPRPVFFQAPAPHPLRHRHRLLDPLAFPFAAQDAEVRGPGPGREFPEVSTSCSASASACCCSPCWPSLLKSEKVGRAGHGSWPGHFSSFCRQREGDPPASGRRPLFQLPRSRCSPSSPGWASCALGIVVGLHLCPG